MLDHLLVDLIATVQDSFERALLTRLAVEERFQVDVFLGDVSWETSYSLPGEEEPPRVRVDVSIDWPTWSQTAYRSWSIGDSPTDMPEALLEIAMRVQRLAEPPVAERIMAVLPGQGPLLGREPLLRTSTTVEEIRSDHESDSDDRGSDGPPEVQWAVEATYEAALRFDEAQLGDLAGTLAPVAEALTRWISSTLVQLADLPLTFHPPDPVGEG